MTTGEDAQIAAAIRSCWRCHFFTSAWQHLEKIKEFEGCPGITGHLRGIFYMAAAEGRRKACTCGLGVEDPERT